MLSDDLLIAVYTLVNIPADQLALDPAAGKLYLGVLASKTTEPIDPQRIFSRLITLRKSGRLPRQQRKGVA